MQELIIYLLGIFFIIWVLADIVKLQNNNFPHNKEYKFCKNRENGKYRCQYFIGYFLIFKVYEWHTYGTAGGQYSDGHWYYSEYDTIEEAQNSLNILYSKNCKYLKPISKKYKN